VNEFLHLLGDPAHWAFEITTDLILAGVAYLLGRIGLRRHDRTIHGIATTGKDK